MTEALYRINPNREQPWNDLPDLPIDQSLYRTVDLLESLGSAKAALARLQGRSAVIPNQGILINTISLQEAKLSSEIENIFTTDDELYKAYSDNTTDQNGASKEVLRYREALWSGHHHIRSNEALNVEYFVKIVQEIKQSELGIRPDFVPTVIKQGGTGPNAGKTIYTPPRGVNIIERKLKNLIEFLNDDEKYPIDPITKMAIGHFQFEAIHPFRDGNGRTGRILNINYLTLKSQIDYPILFLSRYIQNNKEDYYSALAGVSQRGSWSTWLLFMYRAVSSTANLTFDKINEITASKDSILQYLQSHKTDFKKLEVLVEYIFKQPFTKVNHFTNDGVYAEKTARGYLNELAELGVLEKMEISGKHYYKNIELHRILSE